MTIQELIEHVQPFKPERIIYVQKKSDNVEWLHNNREGYLPFPVSEIKTWGEDLDVAEVKKVTNKKTKGGE